MAASALPKVHAAPTRGAAEQLVALTVGRGA